MTFTLRQRKSPRWVRRALHGAVGKLSQHLAEHDIEASSHCPRQLVETPIHGAAFDEEYERRTSSHSLIDGEKEDCRTSRSQSIEQKGYKSYRSMMDLASSDKKSENFLPVAGNIYRYWGLGLASIFGKPSEGSIQCSGDHVVQQLGILLIFLIQLLAPASCITYKVYSTDWGHFKLGLDGWKYEFHSESHGISNLLEHFVATLFLTCLALNGARVIYNDMLASMKINMMLANAPASFVKHVHHLWLWIGPFMDCLLVVQCCVIVYLTFITAATPIDVVYDALAVTFLYNLDDIGGDMGFLSEEDWDEDAVGKEYYDTVADILPEDVDPDNVHQHGAISAAHTPAPYKMAMPLMYVMTLVLPLAYICTSGVQDKPDDVHIQLQKQMDLTMQLQRQLEELRTS